MLTRDQILEMLKLEDAASELRKIYALGVMTETEYDTIAERIDRKFYELHAQLKRV